MHEALSVLVDTKKPLVYHSITVTKDILFKIISGFTLFQWSPAGHVCSVSTPN